MAAALPLPEVRRRLAAAVGFAARRLWRSQGLSDADQVVLDLLVEAFARMGQMYQPSEGAAAAAAIACAPSHIGELVGKLVPLSQALAVAPVTPAVRAPRCRSVSAAPEARPRRRPAADPLGEHRFLPAACKASTGGGSRDPCPARPPCGACWQEAGGGFGSAFVAPTTNLGVAAVAQAAAAWSPREGSRGACSARSRGSRGEEEEAEQREERRCRQLPWTAADFSDGENLPGESDFEFAEDLPGESDVEFDDDPDLAFVESEAEDPPEHAGTGVPFVFSW